MRNCGKCEDKKVKFTLRGGGGDKEEMDRWWWSKLQGQHKSTWY